MIATRIVGRPFLNTTPWGRGLGAEGAGGLDLFDQEMADGERVFHHQHAQGLVRGRRHARPSRRAEDSASSPSTPKIFMHMRPTTSATP